MFEGAKSSGDITCPIASAADTCGSLYNSNIGKSPFSPNINLTISLIRSDLEKLNEEAKAIIILKRELCSCQDSIFQKINSLQNTVKVSSIDDNCISISPGSSDIKKLIDTIRSDIEKIKDRAIDITILKCELWSYQTYNSQKIDSLQKKVEDHR